jgi:hypothetical protein
MAGQNSALGAFRDLVDRLLRATVARQTAVVQLAEVETGSYVVSAPVDRTAIPLNDGRFLRVTIALYFEHTSEGRRLKVRSASYQYQEDLGGDCWMFRYDYLREPKNPHPANHLQIRGKLIENCLPPHHPLERVHFPTMRVSLEAVIRLLADQFRVKCNQRAAIWRPMLAASEAPYLRIAHRSLSGPAEGDAE